LLCYIRTKLCFSVGCVSAKRFKIAFVKPKNGIFEHCHPAKKYCVLIFPVFVSILTKEVDLYQSKLFFKNLIEKLN